MATEPEALTQTRQCPKHGEYQATPMLWPHSVVWDGSWSSCPQCDAALQAELDACAPDREPDPAKVLEGRQRRAGIPERYLPARVSDTPTVIPATDVILLGPEGTGKTHLGCALATEALATDHAARYSTVADMLRHVRSTYDRASIETERMAIGCYVEPDLLVLDEVGRHPDSDHAASMLFEVIDRRYVNKRRTVLCSNLSSADLAEYLGPNIMGRFRETGKMIALDGPSRRQGGDDGE